VSVSPNQDQYAEGTQVTITATPASGWSFANWSGDASGSANPLTVTMNSDKTITANFTEDDEEVFYTLTVNTSGQGSVSVSPNQDQYAEGTQVTITATPASGWSFANWSGDASGSANPLTVTMNSDKTITANFTEDDEEVFYTLTVNTSGQGSVSVSPNQDQYAEGTQVTITATPASGWSFANWSGDASGSANPLTVTMNSDKTITANFERTRLVLLEHFTNAYDQQSIEANQIIYDIARSIPHDFVFISYHTAFPSSDPINSQNPADPAARALYYGISSVPFSVMDGGPDGEGEFDYTFSVPDENDISERAGEAPYFYIDISQNQIDNDLSIEVEVTSVFNLGPLDLTLHVAVLETEVPASLIGIEEDMIFRNVVRKLQPDAGGTPLPGNWAANQSERYSFRWTIENVINPENLALAAFIQDEDTREVYQAGTSAEFGIPTFVNLPRGAGREPGMVFYPNPATDYLFVEFKEYLDSDHILEIYNLSGSMIRTEILKGGRSNYEISTESLPRGVYLFSIRNNRDTVVTTRVLIMSR
jgi:hypothetical protein